MSKKQEARDTIVDILNTVDFGYTDVAVRINPLMTDLAMSDLETLLASETLPHTLVVPKVDSVAQMNWVGGA